jgi:methyl-accepting chemotaxis protein
MAEGINALVEQHVATCDQVLGMVERYAQGDFSLEAPELPGEKRRITAVLRQSRTALVALKDAALALSRAAAEGDFSVRGSADDFQHGFREIVEALNRLMQTADEGLADAARSLGAIAEGDLAARTTAAGAGRFGDLQRAIAATAAQLAGIVGGIQLAAAEVERAAHEIARGNDDLAQRTESQAADLAANVQAVDAIAQAIRGTSDGAGRANAFASGARDVAEKGGVAIQDVGRTMETITASSRRMRDIIATIDAIAFQTNILALNAAVEAARAGELGRGFAVVASEVRSLAGNSAGAAREIRQLIDEATRSIDQGAALGRSAETTMAEIVASVRQVSGLMDDIAGSTGRQLGDVEKLAQSINGIDRATQQNASLVEESAAATVTLTDQARALLDAVARFRLQAGQAAALDVLASHPEHAALEHVA